jgi:hypothetical protein
MISARVTGLRYNSNMHSSSREEVVEAFDALAADLDRALELSTEALTTPERLALLERCEKLRRRLPALEHPVINQIAAGSDPAELGGKLPWAIADRLRITRAEARCRIDAAADLGPRHTITGEPLEPVLPATAAAQRAGELGAEHLRAIRSFWHALPGDVDPAERDRAEAQLAKYCQGFRPDQVTKLAHAMFNRMVPDGLFSDADRAKRRTLVLGRQGSDGMSLITGYLTPEARATIEAMLARFAAPGMANPADDTPCTTGTPSQAAIDNDHRSAGQRNHDALIASSRAMLCSGQLGQHNGLPASIIVSTTLAELEAGAGAGLTGGGTLLPMSDVIRLASHAHHYLAIFDNGKALALYHTKRLASPAQRIVLHAKDRGCSFPGCDIPAYLCQVHHTNDYAHCRDTDIDELTLACGPNHKLVTTGGWTTRKLKNGDTEWIPPPHLDHGQPRTNTFHHPEKLLHDNDDEDP